MSDRASAEAEDIREQVAEVLGTGGFADSDDLFAHGLDSLGLIRLVGAWRERGYDVTFEKASLSPTVAAWSALLRERPAAPADRTAALDDATAAQVAAGGAAAVGPESGAVPGPGAAAAADTAAPGPSASGAAAEDRADAGTPFPLATMQHAYWIGRGGDQPLGGVAPHFYTEFDGSAVDPDRLAAALRAVVDRHPMLRVRFDGDGYQRVLPARAAPRPAVHDLRALPDDEARRRLDAVRDDSTHRRMDVARGQVLDIALSLLPDGATRLHVDLDMIGADALSLRVLLDDLHTAYHGGDLPPLGYTFARYLADRSARRAGERERARTWWRERLADLPAPPELPTVPEAAAAPGPDSALTRSTRLHHWLSPERARILAGRARAAGVTPAAALATVFAEVLGAWSASPRFLLNLPLFDRAPLHPDTDRLIGDFSSSVLLGVDTGPTAAFAERARVLQRDLHQAVDHGAYGGVEVLRDLARQGPGTPVLAPVVYTSAIGLGPLFAEHVQQTFGRPSWIISQGPQVLLDAQVTELDGGLLLNWDLREHAFLPGTMRAAFSCYRDTVERLIDDPGAWDRPFRPHLTAAQRRARAVPAVAADPPEPRLLHEPFFRRARTRPDDAAVIAPDGSATGYGALAERALRVAAAVSARTPPGAVVAVHLPRGADRIAAVLGVLAAGCAYLPLGWDHPEDRRARVLEKGEPALLLCAGGERPATSAGPPALPLAEALAAAPGGLREAAPEDLAYVLFTSGSTGAPKGVEIEHRSAAHTVDVLNGVLETADGDRTLALADFDFDMSVFDLFAPLAVGGAAVLVDSADRRDAARWALSAHRSGVSVLNCVPALLDMLLSAVESGMAPMPPLRAVLLGGDRISPELAGRLRALAPECRFLALGGMTEAAIHSTLLEVAQADPAWPCVPWGHPLPGVLCRVADEQGRDRPDLVAGELHVAGAGLARGYRGDPRATAERFVVEGGRRWYRTGDLARYSPDGGLEFLGRNDGQLKINGVRLETGDVEAALAACPAVADAAVVALTGPAPRLAAVVVPADRRRSDPAAEAALAHARALLPSAMVPETAVEAAEIPLTANGKHDRSAVARLLRGHTASGARRGDPPADGPERRVADVWRDVLGATAVGREDSFFALGGDSLLATRVVGKLRRTGYSAIGVADLFAHPVLADFAARLPERGEARGSRPIVHDPRARYEPFPPTGVQRAYLTGRRPEFALGGVGTYHYTEFDGPDLDVQRLEDALNRLVDRHDMLRAVFDGNGDQRVLAEVPPVRVAVADAGSRDPQAALSDLRAAMSHRVFDPAQWPLFEVRAVRYRSGGTTRVRLAVGLDYLVLDALSIMTFYTELDLLYRDPAAELEPVEITFRDYLTQLPADPDRELRDQEYWRGRAAELPPAPALPLQRDPADVSGARFTRRADHLDEGEWDAFAEAARAVGVTPSTLLLACYGEVLSRWSGQNDLSLTLTLFNRRDAHPGIGRVLGDFTSLSVTSYHRAPGRRLAEAARDLQQRMGADLDHREVSAEWVLRELARRTGAAQAGVPVVFTSSLGVGGAVSMDLSADFPQRVWGLSQSPQVYLDNQVLPSRGGLDVYWDAAEELFRPDVLDAMFAAYLETLRTVARDGAAGLRSAEERTLPAGQRRARARANATGGRAPAGLLHDAFFSRAAERAGHPAVITDDAVLSHGELADRALRIAAGLRERGVRSGDAVGVCLPKSADQICAVLGTLAAGALYVPVGAGQPRLRRERIHQAARTVLAIGDGTGAPRAAGAAELLQSPPLAGPCRVGPDEIAYTVFTSGSTGDPKGVEVAHAAALNTVADIGDRYRVGPGDRVFALSALDFDLSVYDVFGLLGAGGALVLPTEEDRRDAGRWRAMCADHGVTVWNTVPALLDMLLLAADDEAGLPADLRLALVSGDWVGADLAPRLREAGGGRVRLVALGGATEAAIWSNAFDGARVPDGWPSVPYGFPLRNQRYRVVDEHGADCPDWVAGELWIGGAGVARGYRGDPKRTAERFAAAEGERWYRTGDRGRYRPGAVLEFLGRTDRQVKVGGHRLELGEVEAALREHPAVRRAAAAAVGERASRRVVAFAVPAAGTPAIGELRPYLAERLPAHAVPAEIHTVETMPLTANGKVDRAALEAMADRRPVTGEPPADDVEKHIAGVWAELVEAPVADRRANFFAIGGTSLLAIRMITRLRRELADDLSTRAFLAAPTLAALADRIRATRPADVSTGVI